MRKVIILLSALMIFSVSVALGETPQMKPHHQEAGLSCSDCHLGDEPQEPATMEQCLLCHELPEARDDYTGPPDQHDSPHYGPELECENCHHEHEESENFCISCHDFEFEVP